MTLGIHGTELIILAKIRWREESKGAKENKNWWIAKEKRKEKESCSPLQYLRFYISRVGENVKGRYQCPSEFDLHSSLVGLL